MSVPLFSIITINFNNRDGLEKTMNSVLSQEFQDYEYIIIDGGSKDGSKDLIEKYVNNKEYQKHIKYWCSEPDEGIYNAMNKGISKVSGHFVNMLNSGDTFCKNILTPLSGIAKENLNTILYGAVNCFKNNNFTMAFGRNADLLPENMIAHQSCFVPITIYKKYGYYDESFKIVGDYEKFLCFFKNNEHFFYTNLIIANYDNEGISSTNTELVLKENNMARKRYGYYSDPTKKELFIKFIKTALKMILPGFFIYPIKYFLKSRTL